MAGEDVILRMSQSICGKEKTLLSANQMRTAGHLVDDVPAKFGGTQRIKLCDGPEIPLYYHHGLCQMKTS